LASLMRPLAGRPSVPQTGIPRPVLRELLLAHQVGPGRRVLVVGDHPGGLVDYLRFLGIDAESAEDGRRVDLVVILDAELYRGSLIAPGPLATTASLLAGLCPGGSLVFLDGHGKHSGTCYVRHLAVFPGVFRSRNRRGWSLATLQIASSLRTPEEWSALSEAAGSSDEPCCDAAVQPEPLPSRIAA